MKSCREDGDYGNSDDVTLTIPLNANYLNVQSLENEEEFQGRQELSDRQQVIYFDVDRKNISHEDVEEKTEARFLIKRLERIFEASY